jgi:hypothetical protein
MIPAIFNFVYYKSAVGQVFEKNSFRKQTIYIEAASKGAFYSINYDRLFHKREKSSLSYRVGAFIEKDGIAFPMGLSLFTGKQQHHADFSLVLTPYIDHYHSFLAKEDLSDKYLYIASTAGYRYQKVQGGLFFKIAIGPLLFLDPPSDHFWNMDPKLYGVCYGGAGITF